MVLGCWQLVAVVLGFFYYELVLEPPNITLHHSSFSVYKYLLSATLFFFPFSFSQFAFMSYVSSMLASQHHDRVFHHPLLLLEMQQHLSTRTCTLQSIKNLFF
jgi:hypothetical protein